MEPLSIEATGLQGISSIPDIQPIPKREKEYMTPKRREALAKARKIRGEKMVIRKNNAKKTKKVLIGLKHMFESLRKKSKGPVPDKIEPNKPSPIVAPHLNLPKISMGSRQKEREPLIGGSKLKWF